MDELGQVHGEIQLGESHRELASVLQAASKVISRNATRNAARAAADILGVVPGPSSTRGRSADVLQRKGLPT